MKLFPWFTRREQREQKLEDEIRAHLAMAVRERIERGESPAEAEANARREFGNATLVKEVTRDMWGWRWLETLFQDLRYGLRQLRRNPGFAAVAVITLALGVGLNTAMFSMINALLFRPLPVNDPNQIYTLSAETKRGWWGNAFSYQDLKEIRKQTSGIFSDVAGVELFSTTGLSINGKSEPMSTSFVTGNFFKLLGIRPALGRFILPGKGQAAGADPVLVLGYSFWKAHFGSNPNIVGKSASVNGRPVTIIGVAPEGFRPVSSFFDTQGYMPLGMAVANNGTKSDFLSNRQAKSLVLIARVRPRVTQKRIKATTAVVAKRLAAEFPKADEWTNLTAFPLPPTGPDSQPDRSLAVVSALFLSLASMVLIVACLNVTNMLLARANVRRGEIAVRAALGATRGRLTQQRLTESLLLALLGFAGGIAVGLTGTRLLSSLPLPHTNLPIVLDFHYDWRVYTYAFAIALLAAAVTGIIPAMRTTKSDFNEVLHGSARTTTVGGHRLGKTLVVSQVAGSLMLLIVAGLFVRSLLNVQHSDLGFNPHHVLNITLDPHLAGYGQAQAYRFLGTLLERVRGLPGIQSASLAATVPMGNVQMGGSVEVEGHVSPGLEAPPANYNIVIPGYFETMQIPLLRGRDIRETDNKNSMRVAVINQAMAERFWPGEDAIGRQFRLKEDPNHPLEVVGVVKNSRAQEMYLPQGPYFYMALAQRPVLPVTLQVRTAGDPAPMAKEVAGLTRSLEPAIPLQDVQTMSDVLHNSGSLPFIRLGAGLATVMGILALILAMTGVYGIVSYTAAQRTHEIGIRLALGAQRGEILRMVLREGMLIIALGCVAGTLMAFWLSRLVSHFLVGVSGTDPLTFVAASLTLIGVALLACYIPARRAAKVDPMVALRYE